MAKHKTISYRRDQRMRHIERKQRIAYDAFTESWETEETIKEYMPIAGKFNKGNVRNLMTLDDTFQSYTFPDRKRAMSMLDEVADCDMLCAVSGKVYNKLKKIANNTIRCKNTGGHVLFMEKSVSHEDFVMRLEESKKYFSHSRLTKVTRIPQPFKAVG